MGELTIRKLLVPNRGEIAVRIARTCREMGITSVLAHAEDDLSRPLMRAFDEFVSLGAGDARATYLDVNAVVDAARRSGADALHPGYGFLSERAELAGACRDAGVRFVGPSPEAIEAMGSKAGARALMRQAGVPVVPGYDGDDQSAEVLAEAAADIGFPLLVKASAGGGGKGMKRVDSPNELAGAVESARREAERSFGNGRLLLEKLIEEPRHVEFQIFGASDGSVFHLYERDCSLQRRHQKVVEESPAPKFSQELRLEMAAAAVRAAEAVGYRNAGTVEFILAADGSFYFLEMNTRLQVEHPVTELVLGIDLVRAQIETAREQPLPFDPHSLLQRGHAIEVRVYAEDPADGFLPQAGRLARWRAPSGPGVRVDGAVETGLDISVRYDPMLAKICAHADTREQAVRRLSRALAETEILGIRNNVSWLRRVISSEAFLSGEVSTSFLERHASSFDSEEVSEDAAAVAVLLASEARGASRRESPPNRASSVAELVGEWGRGWR